MGKTFATVGGAFFAGGISLVIGLLTLSRCDTLGLWRTGFLGLGAVLILAGCYGLLVPVFPALGPRPQMLREALYWTARRYHVFASKQREKKGDDLALLFLKKHPLDWRMRLATRVNSVASSGATRVSWSLLSQPVESTKVIDEIADHLERLADQVPENVQV